MVPCNYQKTKTVVEIIITEIIITEIIPYCVVLLLLCGVLAS